MVGTAAPQLAEDILPRPLRVVRALVLVMIGMDLLSSLALPGVGTPWLYYPLMLVSAAGAAITLFRPVSGLLVCIVPIGSALLAPLGQDVMPLLVTSVVLCAVASVRIAQVVMLAYLAYTAAAWALDGTARGVAVLILVLVGAGVGVAARVLWWRNGRLDLRIRRLQAQTVRLRDAERLVLADELSQLLVEGLREEQRDLATVSAAADAAELRAVLERADSTAQDTLTQLRWLVSTLRGRVGDAPGSGSVPEDLLGVAEEVEELLVGHGHPTTIDVPVQLPAVGDFARQLLATIMRETGALLVRQAPPGASCSIIVSVQSDRLGVELTHPGPGAVTVDGPLRAAEHRVRVAGGTFDLGNRDGFWRLRATMPVLADVAPRPAVVPPPKRRSRRRDVLRWTAAAVVLAVGLALAVGAALSASRGTGTGWAWWASGSLACAGLAALAWRVRYAVAIMVGVLLISLIGVEPSLVLGQPAQLAIIVLAAVGVLHRVRWAWIVTLGWAAFCLVWFPGWRVQPAAVGLFYPIVGAMVGLAVQHFQRLRTAQDGRLRSATSHHDAARDDVRRELAGELHDIVAHQLSLITMQATGYRDETDAEALRAGLDRVTAINASAQADLALLLHVMRTGAGAAQPETGAGWLSPTAAADAAAATLREAGRPVRVDIDPAIDAADPTTRRTMTRIIREATTNILRYGRPGGTCSIRIAMSGDGLRLTIDNPLPERARHSVHSTGLGLIGLEERLRITGGTLETGAAEGRWRLAAQLPLTPRAHPRPAIGDKAQPDAGSSAAGSTMPNWMPRIRI